MALKKKSCIGLLQLNLMICVHFYHSQKVKLAFTLLDICLQCKIKVIYLYSDIFSHVTQFWSNVTNDEKRLPFITLNG